MSSILKKNFFYFLRVGLNLIPSLAYSGDAAFKHFLVFNFLSYNNAFLEPISFNVA
jgi:hypothetical protein